MTVCFNQNIIVKTYDDYNDYESFKLIKCKDFDGPNNFSILWNQLLILTHNNIIYDKNTLENKFNIKILKLYKKEILKEIDNILYKFLILKYKSMTLYYNNYTIKYDNTTKQRFFKLYELIFDL